jgi:hypothetical protein
MHDTAPAGVRFLSVSDLVLVEAAAQQAITPAFLSRPVEFAACLPRV